MISFIKKLSFNVTSKRDHVPQSAVWHSDSAVHYAAVSTSLQAGAPVHHWNLCNRFWLSDPRIPGSQDPRIPGTQDPRIDWFQDRFRRIGGE